PDFAGVPVRLDEAEPFGTHRSDRSPLHRRPGRLPPCSQQALRVPRGLHQLLSFGPEVYDCSQPTLTSIAPTSRIAIEISNPISRIASVSRAVDGLARSSVRSCSRRSISP